MIEALTFDLDDTFWDNRTVMARVEQNHYEWLDAHIGHAECFPLEEYQRRRAELARRYPLRRGDFTWIRRESLYAMLSDFGLSSESARYWTDATMEEMLRLRHEVDIHVEVPDMLTEFRQRGLKMAAITNGNADIRRLGLAEHFDLIIPAGEWLAPKPDARCFLAALAHLGIGAPRQAMHVGDSWRDDVLPAHHLGMPVAWIDVKNEGHDCPAGVYRLAHVRELPALLGWLAEHA
ncbi:HAD family hydrolase [Kushneria phosphatilytica]|uniref:HAD-IA family hydrolase n=1 Tax=Kushneria phosphatilytica TaxID=657387 RepID=A0A1S1NSP9_9GAMM|nr:HAD-IA family hydrolase [Kushneria phosphatilytica]OHV08373.1 haloacid dehalogenase [Kushneria phosphatilytica]QEL09796.1 HAD-IA family hydrolase [Kushneria phosphatilytica]